MTRKEKSNPVQSYLVKDATTRAPIYGANGKALFVTAHTPKAARHQAKRMSGNAAVTIEPASR